MRKSKWIEKLLALILVFVMMLGTAPMAVLAESNQAEGDSASAPVIETTPPPEELLPEELLPEEPVAEEQPSEEPEAAEPTPGYREFTPASAPVTTLDAVDDITDDFKCPVFLAVVLDHIGKESPPILKGDVENLTYLDAYHRGITDLSGIEHFTALEAIYATGNQLTAIDVSKNKFLTHLSVGSNRLTVLDVGNNTALAHLDCDRNELTELDVSKNLALEHLTAFANRLTVLDVGNNTALTCLECSYSRLTEIDVSKNLALEDFFISANQLSAIDVRENKFLTRLMVHDNNLTVLDVGNNTELTYLDCDNNQLSDLDLDGVDTRLY